MDFPHHGEESKYVDYHICWKSSGASSDDGSCENWCITEDNIEIDAESANHLDNCPDNVCVGTSQILFEILLIIFTHFSSFFFLLDPTIHVCPQMKTVVPKR